MTESSIGTRPRSTDDDIAVLLVDDNQKWANLVARRIRREADDIDVSIAGCANEAMVTLQADEDLDCLVVDYKMPRVTGLELLERVRDEYPRLPYLLVTSEGSENVAAQAVDAGVTDYIIKDLLSDRTGQFVTRIRSAVEQFRLRQAIEESEARYRTVTEQSRDALVCLRRGKVLFANEQLSKIAGRDKNTLAGSDLVEIAIHPDDRTRVEAILEDWYGERTRQALHQFRIVQPDGTIRQCECTGQRITYDGDPAVLVSIRDVTERKRRERELQWERELNRAVHEALVKSQTRDTLEAKVAEQLCEYGYSLAWIGEQDGSALVPRTVDGDESYIDAIDRSFGGDDADSEPSVWAARTGEPQFIQDFTDLFSADWRDAARTYGYRGGAAIPMVYNDVTYGIVSVYHDEPDRFDKTERHLLVELADTVAFAIHSLETEHALTVDRTVTATLQISDENYYLLALARTGTFLECEEVRVDGTVPHDDASVIQYLTVEGCESSSLPETLETHPDVTDVVATDEGEVGRVQVKVTGSVPEAHLARQGVVVHSTTLSADGATLDIELTGREPLQTVLGTLEGVYDDVLVLSITEEPREAPDRSAIASDIADLTDKQAKALQAAFYHGYFEQPRGNTASAIAESLDVSHSTFLQHLHRAQQKLFDHLL